MTDLAAWLLEQIDAEEKSTREWMAMDAVTVHWQGTEVALNRPQADILMRPARVLADCTAKRQLVTLFMPPSDGSYDRWLGDEVLRILALPYVDRPGYREEWRP